MKQETMSILFYIIKSRLLKNGEAPILLRVTIDGAEDEIRIQRSIPVHLWNQAKGCSKGKDRTAIELNEYIRALNLKLLTIHKELALEEAVITPSLLLKRLFGNEERRTVLATFLAHNDECRALIGIDYEKVTINRYDNCARNLAAVIQREFDKEDISFHELTGEFIRKFEIYLKTERKLCQNTLVRYMKCFKKITNMAIANEWLRKDPFAGVKYRQEETNPIFLTMDELEIIMKKRFRIERLEFVRDVFVFCAFTGLAFVDAKELTSDHIFKDNNGSLWIRKGREKMKRRQGACISNVPLLGIPQQILEKYKNHPMCQSGEVCLPMYSNQKMNSYLKETSAV
jgi:integrase